ncbi:MAG: hypothetical protein K6E86_07555 [Bacteroidales bacterium]|nr:hypothetical protein [Bacteroidales bacterium]
MTTDSVVQDGQILYDTLATNVKISVAAGARITLHNAVIDLGCDASCKYSALTCLGDAEIVLEGNNVLHNLQDDYCGLAAAKSATLTLSGDGSLDARGGSGGAGIGCCEKDTCGNIVINGGNIVAVARGSWGAGIGAGYNGVCGDITINAGTVEATGGNQTAGIGSHTSKKVGQITISESVTRVRAIAGAPSDPSQIVSSGATNVYEQIPAIYTGKESSSGMIIFSGSSSSSAPQPITIGSLRIVHHVNNIFMAVDSNVYFCANGGETKVDDREYEFVGGESTDVMSAATAFVRRDSWTFTGWNTAADGTGTVCNDMDALNSLTDNLTKPVTLYAQWTADYMSLSDVQSNMTSVWQSLRNDSTYNVELSGRTIDTEWNTLALPFDVDSVQLCKVFGENVKLYRLGSSTFQDGELTLNFVKRTSLYAGQPYLIQAETTVTDPRFEDVQFGFFKTYSYGNQYIQFQPTLDVTTLEGDDIYSYLILGAGNNLYNPSSLPALMKAFRAYFVVQNLPDAQQAASFRLSFESDEPVSDLIRIDNSGASTQMIYTLDGRRLNSIPVRKGLYIINGKKVLCK